MAHIEDPLCTAYCNELPFTRFCITTQTADSIYCMFVYSVGAEINIFTKADNSLLLSFR